MSFGYRCSAMLAMLAMLAIIGVGHGCTFAECANPDYRDAECRVIAENENARLRTPDGAEIRFQDPLAADASLWDARGNLWIADDGVVQARVAGLGRFAISISGARDGFALELHNVDPRAVVTLEGAGGVRIIDQDRQRLQRALVVASGDGPEVWIRGEVSCTPRYRLAVTADIQTNPDHFRRIVEHLQVEAANAEVAGERLMGLLIAGDLSESSRDDEFAALLTIMAESAVPVAVTAGNHDTYEYYRPNYNDRFGPGNHVFSVCDARVVMLDSGSGEIAHSVEGRLPELFSLQDETHLLVGMHHPPHPGVTGAGWSNEARAQAFLAEAALAGVDLVFAGHKHELKNFAAVSVGDRDVWELIAGTAGANQGIAPPLYGYVRLTIDASGIEACFVEVPATGFTKSPGESGRVDLPLCEA